MTKRNWDTARLRDELGDEQGRAKQIIAVEIDAAFWKAWRDDPAAMRVATFVHTLPPHI